ncbi:MAG TPA: efflux RND transporter permease subunit [Capsulimonadaceae bacterium]|jgi:HAE1 family hydrophobic/amphiphilic exporter-1
MQWLAELSVKRNIFAAVVILLLCVAGGYSYFQLGVDQFPNIDVPVITITTNMTGASPQEMDTAVTDQIEKAVNTVSGIDTLSSSSSTGVSTVTISFVLDKNIDAAFSDVQSKVNAAVPGLPTDADTPTVQKIDTGASSVYTLALSSTSSSMRDLSEYADKTLRPQLESLQGVGQASIVGGTLRQINILIDPYKLRANGLTAIDVSNALSKQNVEMPGGALDSHGKRTTVRTQGQYASAASLSTLVVSQSSGHLVQLGDVATVEDGSEEATSLARYNGQPAVLVKVVKQSGSNTVKLVDSIKSRVADIRTSLPPSYHLDTTYDGSTYIRASVKTAEEHLILGAIFAAVIVLLFLKDWRSTFISSLAIPASIVSTFTLMWSQGFTLNMITLLAVTLCVGIVIDDAILVLENIFRFIKEKGYSPKKAAVEATREIGFAVLATTLSLVAIFLPVGFMSGMIGRILKSFGLTMACAIMVSLIVAFTLTPMLGSRWLKGNRRDVDDAQAGEAGQVAEAPTEESVERKGLYHRVEQWYHDTLAWSLDHRWVIVTASVIVFLGTVPLIAVMNKEFAPNDDQGQFAIDVRLPAGTSIEKTSATLETIAAQVRKLPDIENTVATVGSDAQTTAHKGTIDVWMPPISKRHSKMSETEAIQLVNDKILSHYSKDVVTSVKAAKMGGGGPSSDVQYTISGPNNDVLTDAGNKVVAALRKFKGVADADNSGADAGPEIQLDINRSTAGDLGVSAADIAQTAQIAVAGKKVSTINDGGYRYDVNLRGLPQYRENQSDIDLYSVPSSKLGVVSVPMSQVATYTKKTSSTTISRYARNHSITISANLQPGASQEGVQNEAARQFKALGLPSQYKGDLAGMSKNQGEIFSGFVVVLLLAVVFIYLILAAQFESWLHPITILMVLPLTIPFALLSTYLTGGSLNLFSMLGILVLFGVVKKNSILQVDHSNQLREKGMERNAAVLKASRDRLRPILMTTASFVAGMLPLVFSSGEGSATNKSIGNLIVGGQTLSLVLSLVAIPVFYTIADDFTVALAAWRDRIARRFARNHEAKG